MVNKKVVAICSIIAIIIVVAIVLIQIVNLKKSDYEEEIIEENSNTVNETEENTIAENATEEENTVENSTENETETNNQTYESQYLGEEETSYSDTEENEASGEEIALALAKEEWGEDDTVYYTVDNQTNNVYNISVRSKATTVALAEYEVDIVSGIVK